VQTRRLIESPADWQGRALAESTDWVYHLTAADAADVDRAFRAARETGATLDTLTRETFPLTSFVERLEYACEFIENQRVTAKTTCA
jgi:hypothetical protein